MVGCLLRGIQGTGNRWDLSPLGQIPLIVYIYLQNGKYALEAFVMGDSDPNPSFFRFFFLVLTSMPSVFALETETFWNWKSYLGQYFLNKKKVVGDGCYMVSEPQLEFRPLGDKISSIPSKLTSLIQVWKDLYELWGSYCLDIFSGLVDFEYLHAFKVGIMWIRDYLKKPKDLRNWHSNLGCYFDIWALNQVSVYCKIET